VWIWYWISIWSLKSVNATLCFPPDE
jgi:hypothetical protein